MNWFDVDKAGLAKLLERRGKAFAVTELIQNAWDTAAKRVEVTLEPVTGRPFVYVKVTDDDPDGFKNLTHAFTLFAESEKKGDASKRGRFNLGEKLVLALCESARIETTTGTVVFAADGRRTSKVRRVAGSEFSGVVRMTRTEYEETMAVLLTLIPPPHVETLINGAVLARREPAAIIDARLPTEVADEEGVLRRTERLTSVLVYEPLAGEIPSVYELGIPVVETGDRWHMSVEQKVPLSFDRDNLPPAYLRKLRVLVLNEMASKLSKDDANATWVRDAGSDKDASDEAMTKVMDLRFGEKRVAYDPSDPEANALAVAKGYTVVHGGMLNAQEWSNVKRAGVVRPAGQVTPSPKPYSEDGDPQKLIPEEKWTPGMKRVAKFANDVAFALIGRDGVRVHFTSDITWPFGATYGGGDLTFNLGRLGHRFFNEWAEGHHGEVEQLLIHEFAHHRASNHLSSEFYDECCRIGAHLARLALARPGLWR